MTLLVKTYVRYHAFSEDFAFWDTESGFKLSREPYKLKVVRLESGEIEIIGNRTGFRYACLVVGYG